MKSIITLLFLGFSVGLGNFGASIAIGLSGVNKKTRTKVAIVFGAFETGMPIVGLVIGKQLSTFFNNKANLIGGILLLITGLYEIISSLRKQDEVEVKKAYKSWNKLLLSGLALSIDNLIIGFSLGAYKEPFLLSALIIGATSVTLVLIGLEVGNRLNKKVEKYSEIISGSILILVGIAVALKII